MRATRPPPTLHALQLAGCVFGVIFVAELPDKTALAALVLATRYRPLPVFLGAALALTVQSIVAVAAGSMFSLLPARPVHIGAGVVFLVSAVAMWIGKAETREDVAQGESADDSRTGPAFWRPMTTVFGVVFVAEWGDLTQFATAAFAAHERAPLVVFCAATLALWVVAGIAVGIGNRAASMLDVNVTKRVAGGLFVAVGIGLIAGWL
jgi:putative Ca2+/H+ antiporter (TMEM165/GDT1 family)